MTLYIDPSYTAYYQNKLFNLNDENLNRDGGLIPYYRLKEFLESQGIKVSTFDLYNDNDSPATYWSMGVIQNYEALSKNQNLKLDSFFIFEPPLVAPQLYSELPILTKYFDKVYIHNTTGNGYSTKNVTMSKLKKLFWPQPYNTILEGFWANNIRKNAISMINGLHRPNGFCKSELYTARMKALVSLSKHFQFDLYGRGWGKILSRNAMSWTYLYHYSTIMSNYHGSVHSKYETYSKYDFALCFENLIMDGYITEKIFDCFYAGTIPIYKGASDIGNYIPENCFINFAAFKTTADIVRHLKSLTPSDKLQFRKNARTFLESKQGTKFSDSLINEGKNLLGRV